MKTKVLNRMIIFCLIVVLLVGMGCKKKDQMRDEKIYRKARNDLLQYCYELLKDHGKEVTALADVFLEFSPMKERIIYSYEYRNRFLDERIYLSWDAREFGPHPPEEILRAYYTFREKSGYLPLLPFSKIWLLDNNTLGFEFNTTYCDCYLVYGDMNVALEFDSSYRNGITKDDTRSAGFVHLDDNWTFLWFVNLVNK